MSAAAEATENVAAPWLSIAQYLGAVFEREMDQRSLAERLFRISGENPPQSLLARLVGDAFEKDGVHLDVAALPSALRNGPVLAWDVHGAPFLVTGRSIGGRYRITEIGADAALTDATLSSRSLRKRYAGGQAFEDRAPLDVWKRGRMESIPARWFRDAIGPLRHAMRPLLLASLTGNLLAVGVSLFALQVWDRVIPAHSLNSLIVLLIGVCLAILFELTLRLQRGALIDAVGTGVDAEISGRVFSHMLSMKSDARPKNLGVLAAQIREIHQIREAFASSMLSSAIDLPFTLVFVGVIWLIGGALVGPILVAIAAVIGIGLLAQVPLARLAKEGLEEASLRNGLIVEAVLKADEIKLQQAEPTLQLRWDQAVATANAIGNRQRRWRNILTGSTQSIQQLAYVLVVSLGAYSVIQGDGTMGQVIACSILANRSIAPLTQVSAVLGALQGSVAAKSSIDALMTRPTDSPTKAHLRRDLSAPSYAVANLRYTYPETERGALQIPRLDIPFGSNIGIIGRVGSGKSTLLRLLSGLAEPVEGSIRLDGTDLSAIHPADLRSAIGFQSQGAALLHGTVRDNLRMAQPTASDEEMMAACVVSGASSLMRDNPHGLDLIVNEAGEGLSGGQRQSLLLARTILRSPPIALMDEPTASMDDESEANFITALRAWSANRTLIVATHRRRPLALCDRILVVHEGRILKDGPRDTVLADLRKPKAKA